MGFCFLAEVTIVGSGSFGWAMGSAQTASGLVPGSLAGARASAFVWQWAIALAVIGLDSESLAGATASGFVWRWAIALPASGLGSGSLAGAMASGFFWRWAICDASRGDRFDGRRCLGLDRLLLRRGGNFFGFGVFSVGSMLAPSLPDVHCNFGPLMVSCGFVSLVSTIDVASTNVGSGFVAVVVLVVRTGLVDAVRSTVYVASNNVSFGFVSLVMGTSFVASGPAVNVASSDVSFGFVALVMGIGFVAATVFVASGDICFGCVALVTGTGFVALVTGTGFVALVMGTDFVALVGIGFDTMCFGVAALVMGTGFVAALGSGSTVFGCREGGFLTGSLCTVVYLAVLLAVALVGIARHTTVRVAIWCPV